MKLITISGLDGSGKSTQIEMLKNELKQNGSKVFYFHAVQFSLANRIFPKNKSSENKSVTTDTAFRIWLRKLFLRIDIWRFSLLRNKLRSKGYDYILSDRYFYDSVINIEYLELRRGLIDQTSTKIILAPDVAIYLQTSPEKIMQRDRVPDQGLDYLQKKKKLYDVKTSEWHWQVIDGDRDKDVIFEEIRKTI